MKLRKTMIVLAVSSAAAFGVAACGDDDNDTSTSAGSGATTTASGGEASVSFVEPTDGATVSNPVTAEVQVENFTLNAQAVGKENVEGEGHLHFSMDGGKYDFPKYSGANGKLAKKLGVQGKYSPSVAPTITYSGLPKGKHTLKVNLANNDHSNAGGTASVSFTVK